MTQHDTLNIGLAAAGERSLSVFDKSLVKFILDIPNQYLKKPSRMRFLISLFFAALFAFSPTLLVAQDNGSQGSIETPDATPSDGQIKARITEIFRQIGELTDVNVNVESGVVKLSGITSNAEAAIRAEQLAQRVNGVATVENEIGRDVSVVTRVTPAIDQLQQFVDDAVKLLPLLLLALLVFSAVAFLGWLLSSWKPLWRRVAPNRFVADLLSSSVRTAFIVIAAVAALSLLDATALLGAFLGAAGVLGLAIGFAVRDTIENYISSVMLSLRQPFRPNDHVVIDGHEGRVIRLTSRATILMTLQGNHLRIPNSSVFKAVILNYTTNPERSFEFELGVDADDNPIDAMEVGLNVIKALPFVLKDPEPAAYIKDVGDSNIVIFFTAWFDQSAADFHKSRSVALFMTKSALEDAGFALPEPIYRLRFDEPIPSVPDAARRDKKNKLDSLAEKNKKSFVADQIHNVAPATDISEKVEEERREHANEDLLSDNAQVE